MKALDEDVKALLRDGNTDDAASRVIQAYGPEIFGLLMAIHRDEGRAGDVFSVFSEKLWRGIARFEGRSSLRTWAYALARNASSRYLRDLDRRRRREVPVSTSAPFRSAVQDVRSRTMEYLRTETKNEFRKLRESLPEDDQTLLILRVDRELEWLEIAEVFLEVDEGTVASEDALKKEASRLRKRFQLVKERLTKMGKDQGLI